MAVIVPGESLLGTFSRGGQVYLCLGGQGIAEKKRVMLSEPGTLVSWQW